MDERKIFCEKCGQECFIETQPAEKWGHKDSFGDFYYMNPAYDEKTGKKNEVQVAICPNRISYVSSWFCGVNEKIDETHTQKIVGQNF
jgi:hypothetical protein